MVGSWEELLMARPRHPTMLPEGSRDPGRLHAHIKERYTDTYQRHCVRFSGRATG